MKATERDKVGTFFDKYRYEFFSLVFDLKRLIFLKHFIVPVPLQKNENKKCIFVSAYISASMDLNYLVVV
jgi:hypothetical protein